MQSSACWPTGWSDCWRPPDPPRYGVTDGSIAAPGVIGEIIGLSGNVAYPANAVGFAALTTMGILTAGDWSMQAWMVTTSPIDAFILDNVPTTNLTLTAAQQNALIPKGMGWMGVAMGVSSTGTVTTESAALGTIVSFYRGAKAIPLVLRTVIDSGSTAGVMELGFLARRMR